MRERERESERERERERPSLEKQHLAPLKQIQITLQATFMQLSCNEESMLRMSTMSLSNTFRFRVICYIQGVNWPQSKLNLALPCCFLILRWKGDSLLYF